MIYVIKGAELGKMGKTANSKCLLLASQLDQTVDLPDWCEVMPISTWLLG